MELLTKEKFDLIPGGDIFASGIIKNEETGIYMTSTDIGRELLWIAKKGYGDDWAIYTHWASNGLKYVLEQGDKICTDEYIKKLVPCTDEIFKRYRK
jgi:hypothetical protein